MQTPKQPGGLLGALLSGLLRWVVYAVFFWAMVLVGSAVLRRAAATQSAAANSMSGMAAAPSLPGPGSAAGYAPKEYIKVRSAGEIKFQSNPSLHAKGPWFLQLLGVPWLCCTQLQTHWSLQLQSATHVHPCCAGQHP
jgi:hypothetical protein